MPTPFKYTFLATVLFGLSTIAFAEDAPVYDVDSYPPQFDGTTPEQHAAQQPKAQTFAPGAADSSQAYIRPPTAAPDNTAAGAPPPPPQNPGSPSLNPDVSSRLNDMQTDIQTLRGQVETLNHQVQQMQTQMKTMYSDLDKRIGSSHTSTASTTTDGDTSVDTTTDAPVKPKKSKTKVITTPSDGGAGIASDADEPTADPSLEKTSADAAMVTATPKTDNQPNVAEEQQIYQTAYGLIKAKKYNEAATTLQKMLQKYPSGQFAANAHYWLGELYGLMGKNDRSVTEFSTVVKNYPDSPKLADAQLKLGLIYAAQLKWSDAKSSFKKVINRYPGTSSAHLAAEQLKQIKQAGH